MFNHQGDITHDILQSLLLRLEKDFNKKIFGISLELLQNIATHGDGHDATFRIDADNNAYAIMSRNKIKNTDIPTLENKLHHISSLDRNALNDLYKEVIQTPTISNKAGAGLGLIDIARKSDEKLQWSFTPIDDSFSFFCIFISCKK